MAKTWKDMIADIREAVEEERLELDEKEEIFINHVEVWVGEGEALSFKQDVWLERIWEKTQ